MMDVACVQNNVVVNTQLGIDPNLYSTLAQQYQLVVDITDLVPQPQNGWQLINSQLICPNGPGTWRITKLALRERFTIAEMTGILTAAASNFTLQAILGNQQVAIYVDLTRSDTIAGVEYLVSLGLITQGRATQILTAPPTSNEIYVG